MTTTMTSVHVPFEQLQVGDHIQVTHRIKVGLSVWHSVVRGKVLRKGRQRNGLHVDRAPDDRAFQDFLVLQKDGPTPEETTVTLDEFTILERLPA